VSNRENPYDNLITKMDLLNIKKETCIEVPLSEYIIKKQSYRRR